MLISIGPGGIHAFLCSHKCNEICGALGLRQPRIEYVEVDIVCPLDAQPGDEIQQFIPGPDEQMHDWKVPPGVVPGRSCRVRVPMVTPADRAAQVAQPQYTLYC
jgi:hypothetical protein